MMTDQTPPQTQERQPEVGDYQPPQAGAVTNLVCGVVITALGLLVGLEAWGMGVGSLASPTSGTWPAALSGIMVALGIAIAVRARTFDDAEKLTTKAVAVGVGAIALVITAQLMPLIGFEIPAFALMVFWMSVLGGEKYRISVPVGLVTVVATYLIFITGLGVPLPRLF